MRITKKNFQVEELPYESFLTTRQKNKIRNAFAKDMSTDIRFSKAQISRIIQLSGFLCGMLGSLGNVGKVLVKKAITDFAVPFATDVLPGLVNNSASNATSNVIDKLGRKISGKGAV